MVDNAEILLKLRKRYRHHFEQIVFFSIVFACGYYVGDPKLNTAIMVGIVPISVFLVYVALVFLFEEVPNA